MPGRDLLKLGGEGRTQGRDLLGGFVQDRYPSTLDGPEQDEFGLFSPVESFGQGLWAGLGPGNLSMFGGAMEAAGLLSDSDTLSGMGGVLQGWSKNLESTEPPVGWEDAKGVFGVLSYLSGLTGSGIGSTIPPIAGGMAGGALGAAAGTSAAGPAGGAVGGAVGAAGGAFTIGMALNVGEAYLQFKEEGVDPETAAQWAVATGPVMGVLDTIGLSRVIGKTALQGARKTALRKIAHEASKVLGGAAEEGVTETAQSAVREVTAAHLTGNANTRERVLSALEEGLAGALTGGALTGGGRALNKIIKSRSGRPTVGENAAGSAGAEATGGPLDDLAAEGQRFIDEAVADGEVSNPALSEFDLPGVGVASVYDEGDGPKDVTIGGYIEPDGDLAGSVVLRDAEGLEWEEDLPLRENVSLKAAATPEEKAEVADDTDFTESLQEELGEIDPAKGDEILQTALQKEGYADLAAVPKERRGKVLSSVKKEAKKIKDAEQAEVKAQEDAIKEEEKVVKDTEKAIKEEEKSEADEIKRQDADRLWGEDLTDIRSTEGVTGEQVGEIESSVAKEMDISSESVPEERRSAYSATVKKRLARQVRANKKAEEAGKKEKPKTPSVPQSPSPKDLDSEEPKEVTAEPELFEPEPIAPKEPLAPEEALAPEQEGNTLEDIQKAAMKAGGIKNLTAKSIAKKVAGFIEEAGGAENVNLEQFGVDKNLDNYKAALEAAGGGIIETVKPVENVQSEPVAAKKQKIYQVAFTTVDGEERIIDVPAKGVVSDEVRAARMGRAILDKEGLAFDRKHPVRVSVKGRSSKKVKRLGWGRDFRAPDTETEEGITEESKKAAVAAREFDALLAEGIPVVNRLDNRTWSKAIELSKHIISDMGRTSYESYRSAMLARFGPKVKPILKTAYANVRDSGEAGVVGLTSDVEIARKDIAPQAEIQESKLERILENREKKAPRAVLEAVKDETLRRMSEGTLSYRQYAADMVARFGENVRKYLKSAYRAVRDVIRRVSSGTAKHKAVLDRAVASGPFKTAAAALRQVRQDYRAERKNNEGLHRTFEMWEADVQSWLGFTKSKTTKVDWKKVIEWYSGIKSMDTIQQDLSEDIELDRAEELERIRKEAEAARNKERLLELEEELNKAFEDQVDNLERGEEEAERKRLMDRIKELIQNIGEKNKPKPAVETAPEVENKPDKETKKRDRLSLDKLGDAGERMEGKNAHRYEHLKNEQLGDIEAEVKRLMDMASKTKLFPSKVPNGSSEYLPAAMKVLRKKYETFLPFLQKKYGYRITDKWTLARLVRHYDSDEQAARLQKLQGYASEYMSAMETVWETIEGMGRIDEVSAALRRVYFDGDGTLTKFAIDSAAITDTRHFAGRNPERAKELLNEGDTLTGLVEYYNDKLLGGIDVFSDEDTIEGNNDKDPDQRLHYSFDKKLGPDRTGFADRRNGEHKSGEDLVADYGLRGFDIGVSMSGLEKQRNINWAYDALGDLAETLGLPPRAMGLGGWLGLSLGSRGKGPWAGTYSPGDKIINLTRKSGGDGVLAHEWGHAMDHRLGYVDAYRTPLQRRPDADSAVKNVKEILKSEKYVISTPKSSLDDASSLEIAKWYVRGETPTSDLLDLDGPGWQQGRNYRDISDKTDFMKNSEEADRAEGGKPYFGTRVEMFARAWEAWLYDRMHPSKSQFLVNEQVAERYVSKDNGYRSITYPEGQDRVDFVDMFDEFIEQITIPETKTESIELDFVPGTRLRENRDKGVQDALEALDLEALYEELRPDKPSHMGLYWYVSHRPWKPGNQAAGYDALADTVDEQMLWNSQRAKWFAYSKPLERALAAGKDMNASLLTEGAITLGKLKVTDLREDSNEGDAETNSREVEDDETGTGQVPSGEQPNLEGDPDSGEEDGGDGTGSGEEGGATDSGDTGGPVQIPVPPGGEGGPGSGRGSGTAGTATDYVIGDEYSQGLSEENRLTSVIKRNTAALKTLVKIGERQAVTVQKHILARFEGIKSVGSDTDASRSGEADAEMNYKIYLDTLVEAGLEQRDAMQVSYGDGGKYTTAATPVKVAQTVWEAVEKIGFTGGKVLDSTLGVGRFFGTMPTHLRGTSGFTGYEESSLMARIAKQLYHSAGIIEEDFGVATVPSGYFDLSIADLSQQGHSQGFSQDKQNELDEKTLAHAVKTIQSTRQGGLSVLLVDGQSFNGDVMSGNTRKNAMRQISKDTNLLGAIRMPATEKLGNNYFDILFLQKRMPKDTSPIDNWHQLENFSWETAGYWGRTMRHVKTTKYFVDNWNQVLGVQGTTDNDTVYNPKMPEGTDEWDVVLGRAMDGLPSNKYIPVDEAFSRKAAVRVRPAEGDLRDGSLSVEKGGGILMRIGDEDAEILRGPRDGKQRAQTVKLVGVRNVLMKLWAAQIDEKPMAEKEQIRAELNAAYDDYVENHGYINATIDKAVQMMAYDPDVWALMAIEQWDRKASVGVKRPVFFEDTIKPHVEPTSVSSAKDAMQASLEYKSGIEIPYMAKLSGLNERELAEALRGEIYNDPEAGWVTKEEYLAGDIRKKLKIAEAVAKSDKRYEENVKALQVAIPAPRQPGTQLVALPSAGWIDDDSIREFAMHIGGGYSMSDIQIDGKGKIKVPDFMNRSSNVRYTWGTPRMNGYDLINHLRAGTQPTVVDVSHTYNPITQKSKRVKTVNRPETLDAINKMEEVQAEFERWAWDDSDSRGTRRRARLIKVYDETLNAFQLPTETGEHLVFPELSEIFKAAGGFFKHQLKAIARVIKENTYLAHEVGTGKTFILLTAAMKLRQLGVAKKPVIVVQGNKLEEFMQKELRVLYPTANALAINVPARRAQDAAKRGTAADNNRRRYLEAMERIKLEDHWDVIVMSHESFDNIQMGPEFAIAELNAEMDKPGIRDGERRRIEAKIEKLRGDRGDIEEGMGFNHLGIDAILVDEAHRYKNLPIKSKIVSKVEGIPVSNSDRAEHFYEKTRYVNDIQGRVVLASGSPVPNSIAEIHTLQKQLQPELLKSRDMFDFDNWFKAFGVLGKTLDPKPEGQGYEEKFSFKKFTNINGMMQLAYQTIDFASADLVGIKRPSMEGGKAQVKAVVRSEQQDAIQADIVQRAIGLRDGNARVLENGKNDSMLKIVGDGRALALDTRLLGPDYVEDKSGKAAQAVDLAYQIYNETSEFKGTQLIFSEQYQSSANPGFNLFKEMRDKLVAKGIPKDQIAIIHDIENNGPAKKKGERLNALYDAMNDGDIRILFGTAAKGGQGVNVQERGAAIIHLDTSWNAQGMIQKNGRFIRQGNRVEEEFGWKVRIINFALKDSIENFMWGKVRRKVMFSDALLNGNALNLTEFEDLSSETMTASEVISASSGDPRIRQQEELKIELDRFFALESAHNRKVHEAQQEAIDIPEKIESRGARIAGVTEGLKGLENITEIKWNLPTKDGKTPMKFKPDAKGIEGAWQQRVKYAAKNEILSINDNPIRIATIVSPNGNYPIMASRSRDIEYVKKITKEAGGVFDARRTLSIRVKIPHLVNSMDSDSKMEELIKDTVVRGKGNIKYWTSEIEQMQKSLESFDSIINAEFKHKEAMEEALDKLQVIEGELSSGKTSDEPRLRVILKPEAYDEVSTPPQGTEDATRVAAEVERVASRILPKEVTVKTGQDLGAALGSYRRGLIQIAAKSQDPARILRHEAIHALWGRFSTDEQTALLEAVEESGAVDRYDLYERYGDLFNPIGGVTAKVREEAVAHMYEDWAKNDTPGLAGLVVRVFTRIRRMLRRLREALKGIEIVDLDSVFQRVESGEIAAREAQGVVTEERMFRAPDTDGKFVLFSDDKLVERFEEAKKGKQAREGMFDRIREWAPTQWQEFKRSYEHLPQTPENAKAREVLRILSSAPNVAAERTIQHLNQIMSGLSKEQIDLLTAKVFMDDFFEDVRRGLDIPMFDNHAQFKKEYIRLNNELKKPAHKDIMKRVRQRRNYIRKIGKKLIESGLISPDAAERANYISHDVLEYAHNEVRAASAKGVKLPKWAARKGTKLAINMNLMEAEAQYLTRSLVDLASVKAINEFKGSKYNAREQVLSSIRVHNLGERDKLVDREAASVGAPSGYDNMVEWWKEQDGAAKAQYAEKLPMFLALNSYRQSLGIHFGKIQKLLTDHDPDVPQEFRDAMESLAGFVDDEMANDIKVWPALSWAAAGNLDGYSEEFTKSARAIFSTATQRRQFLRENTENWIGTSNMANALAKLKRAGNTEFDAMSAWQPDKGNLMFTATTLSEKVMNKINDRIKDIIASDPNVNSILDTELVQEVADSMKSQTVVGGPKFQLVLPSELSMTLDQFKDTHLDRQIDGIIEKATRVWKIWTLISPARLPKYTIRNVSGDLDHVIAAMGKEGVRPEHLKQSWKELWDVMVGGKPPTAQYQRALDRGVMDSGFALTEVFDQQREVQGALTSAEKGLAPLRKGWRALQKANTFRENILRYSVFMSMEEQLAKKTDNFKQEATTENIISAFNTIGYGAVEREHINGLDNWQDIAANYARETLGDYANISVGGSKLRKRLIPFWSWKEINLRWYARFIANTAYHVKLGKGVSPEQAKAMAKIGVKSGIKAGALLYLRMVQFAAMVHIWNNLAFGDEEDELSDADRRRLHLIIGKWNGETIMLPTPGAFSDILQWVGYEDVISAFEFMRKGRGTIGDVVEASISGFANTLVGGITPAIKIPAEQLAGIETYPNVFRPRKIKDRWHHIQRALSVDKYADLAGALTGTGRPTQGPFSIASNLVVDKRHAGYSAYTKIRTEAFHYKANLTGEDYAQGAVTERSTAYYYYRLALKFGDNASAKKYLEKLRELGVTIQQRREMLERAKPLGMMTRGQQVQFRKLMTPEERRLMVNAEKYWRDTYAGN